MFERVYLALKLVCRSRTSETSLKTQSMIQIRNHRRGILVHILLGGDERHGLGVGRRRGSSEGGRVPLGKEAIRMFIFAPLVVLRVSAFLSRIAKES